MQIIKHAVISAAGLGSRLELNMPKCLVEIGGRKLIDYQLDLLKSVEDVRVVVGFMEEAVMEHVRKVREDVTFVRNPDYRTTSNSYSVFLATRDLNEPFLNMDGDLLIDPTSYERFVSEISGQESVIGITESKTEEAVFVCLDPSRTKIERFCREPRQAFEWSGLAYLKDIKILKNGGYIYKELERHLPLKVAIIDCYEIDTPDDLSRASDYFAS